MNNHIPQFILAHGSGSLGESKKNSSGGGGVSGFSAPGGWSVLLALGEGRLEV